MKLYLELWKAFLKKCFTKKNNGKIIKEFCEKMGIVYIKLAQILSTQNFGNIFSEKDRLALSSICDTCNPISFEKIKNIVETEYLQPMEELFLDFEKKPVGSASISQVHRAILKDGSIVAVKIKRKDITKNIEKDIKTIKKLMKRFGKFVGFKNQSAGNVALDLYLSWIYEETNFYHELQNIKTYNEFSNSVNRKIKNTKNIHPLKVYENYCTENIIVMAFIEEKTINKLPLTENNKNNIQAALNSYLQLSFYALFHQQKIVFHGDPHGGNIYLSENGDIGFLDMGLLFILSESDAECIKEFFLAAFTQNHQKLIDLLLPYGNFKPKDSVRFQEDIMLYCKNVAQMSIPSYFTEVITICLKYEYVPPKFLFSMSKAFLCLNGINEFSKNETITANILKEQVMEYYVKRSLNNFEDLIKDGITLVPKLLLSTCKNGLTKGISKEINAIETTYQLLNQTVKNSLEILEIMKKKP